MRKVSAASVEACPQCAKETFSKQLSAPSFQLSGTGWYATDFKGGGSSASAKSPSSASEPASETSAAPAACATGCACH